jgi:hypothetical protein
MFVFNTVILGHWVRIQDSVISVAPGNLIVISHRR